ncbi:transmembrane protein 131-like isoform X2 [Xenopus laevis]|uniref:Transmembrane protein 131-like isoform X2 n=2 Tax=Xenopus laevis TaxID=8355 RepID=A0A1L8HUB6_XENLA|nr:transmembrane protein 131-like isoform X2 [Xenopus laevis]OCT99691.1 hypothetical protein XELAEV_18005474mg [Xenopus laevis]
MAGLLYPLRASECSTATTVNILLGVFHVLLPCFRQGGGQVIEPVPSMVELWQAEEAELMLHSQTDSDQNPGENPQEQNFARPSGRALHLQPSVLDFGTQSLGLPKVQTFCAFNPCRDRDVEVNSVFTSGRHFHVSPIQSRVIRARGKASFTVVFLPDNEGNFESSIFINTSSHGILSYQVFGVGIPAAGSDDSKNALQNTDVIFPHIANIHLSQSQSEAINSSVWQVRLKCSVPFKKHQQGKNCLPSGHSLLLQIYFAVRLDGGQHDLETLRNYVLENIFMIFVRSSHNGNIDDPTIGVYVLNSGSGLVHMQDVHHFLGDTLTVNFEPVMLLSASINFTRAATISCSAIACDLENAFTDDNKWNVPEAAAAPYPCISHNVTDRYLGLDLSNISFYMQPLQDPIGLWSIWLENNFNFHISLSEVSVAQGKEDLLKILNFTRLLALPPGCWKVFTFKIQAKDAPLNYLTYILVGTSLGTTFKIPVHVQSAFSKLGNMQDKIHAQCGEHPLIRILDAGGALRWQQSLSLSMSAWGIDYELGTEIYEKYQKMHDGENVGKENLEGSRSARQKSDGKKHFVSFLPQLITKPGVVVNFTATALSNNSIMHVTLKNPTPFPVTVQLLPLSHYPNPQAALSMLSKWYGVKEQAFDVTTAEFRLQKECSDMHEEPDECSTEVLELQLLPWESQRIGVIFTPLDYRKVTSLILIRNNLTILDMITVEGVGAREMLRMGGRLPGIGGSLRFKVPESTLMDCRQQLKESKQILSITKVFKVENIGSLPITIQSMKINGYSCQGFGFEVLDCHAFSLSQNSSREISIVFIPDFTSSWVIRELTLVSASNLEFRFTLNVTLPHHLLPLCADGVPGPSWENSFWKITVLCVSFSLLAVILIATQHAHCILIDFLKSRHRNCAISASPQISSQVDTITSESFRGSCKNYTDSFSSPDKGKGRGCLTVTAPQNRSQNASKRGPATYSHSQKKHKCSVYYSVKQKSSSSAASSIATLCDASEQQTSDMPSACPKDSDCNEIPNLTESRDMDNERHLSSPDSNLGKEESAKQDPHLQQRTVSESPLKEDPVLCMFPMETNLKTSESLSEPKLQPDFCDLPVPSKMSVSHLSKHLSHPQMESRTVSKKNEGNRQQTPPTSHREALESTKKQVTRDASNEKISRSTSREEKLCGRTDALVVKHEEPLRKKIPTDRRDGIFQNLNWNKNRSSARKNKKKNSIFPARGTEQNDLKHKWQEVERSDIRGPNRLKHWNSLPNGDLCKGEPKNGRFPLRGDTECYQILKKKPADKFSSDSSSDCSSSRGSVRASRGSWGSWSSASSSEGDKKNGLSTRHFIPSRESMAQSGYPAEAPIALNLSHSICNTSSDINAIPHYPEMLSPSYTSVPDTEKSKGRYSHEDIWSTQPTCLPNDVNYNVENTVACVLRDPTPVQNSFINWNSTCDGQFSGMYGPLELNDLAPYNEENMNYHSGFSCPEVQSPAFIDHQCQPTWNMSAPVPPAPPQDSPMPSTWEPASYSYLSSTRSLSPMSGLFGSIWAPRNDAFDGCCPISGSPPHSEHIGNQSVMCKQEYSPRFNPFHAYMNLDIWTATANRNAAFPISRDSGYCGNL